MIRNYLKTAFRIITRNKAYSFLNIIGLATGMAACLLILLYVQYELSFDRYHQKASQIYRIIKEDPGNYYLGSNQYAVTPAPLAQALIDEYPEILSVTRIESLGNNLPGFSLTCRAIHSFHLHTQGLEFLDPRGRRPGRTLRKGCFILFGSQTFPSYRSASHALSPGREQKDGPVINEISVSRPGGSAFRDCKVAWGQPPPLPCASRPGRIPGI